MLNPSDIFHQKMGLLYDKKILCLKQLKLQNKHSFFLTFWTICFQGSPYCICIFQLLYFNCFVFLLCDAAQCIGGMGQWCCTKASNGSENVGHGVIGDTTAMATSPSFSSKDKDKDKVKVIGFTTPMATYFLFLPLFLF